MYMLEVRPVGSEYVVFF